jgi:hypothetical protein
MRYAVTTLFALLVAVAANAAPFGDSATDKSLSDLPHHSMSRRSTRSYSYAPSATVQSNAAQNSATVVAPSAPANKGAATTNSAPSTTQRRSTRSYSYSPRFNRGSSNIDRPFHERADSKTLERF